MRNLKRERIIENIIQQLQDLEQDQLETVQQAILSISPQNPSRLHSLGKLLGFSWNEDKEEMIMELGPFNANIYGVAQGGALYTFADVAIGFKILNQLKEKQKVFTLEMKMNFIKKGSGSKLIAQTEILHWGRKTIIGQCRIFDESKDIIAQSLGTFYLEEEK
ncbi:PaaI family thioesterase [Ammoniphilus sp. YIM 78166]|uniref:PaaI family thioesterase n=1 Tax=Ammoniphilus sp. YIM 78166 TaxID=1644106 RepID=UPI00106FABEF|nr:PaaI family thioesterase [Ammoniphilus sp. YIM 78166]